MLPDAMKTIAKSCDQIMRNQHVWEVLDYYQLDFKNGIGLYGSMLDGSG
jgi:hypothetical protein